MDAALPASAEAPAEPAPPEEHPAGGSPAQLLQAAFIPPDAPAVSSPEPAPPWPSTASVNYTCDVALEGKIVAILMTAQPETGSPSGRAQKSPSSAPAAKALRRFFRGHPVHRLADRLQLCRRDSFARLLRGHLRLRRRARQSYLVRTGRHGGCATGPTHCTVSPCAPGQLTNVGEGGPHAPS